MNRNKRSAEARFVHCLSAYMEDPQLNVWHLAILAAILSLGYRQKERYRITVSRRKLMFLSHVGTLPTFHKYFRELQDLGYVRHFPSFHPGCRSEVELDPEGLPRFLR